MHARRKRWLLLGGVFGAGIGAVVVSALAVFAGAGIAARADTPVNTDPPTISGTPEEGKTLTGDRGKWGNKPTDFNYFWRRCDKNGGSCSNIGGAHALKYVLTSADVGNTLRLRVDAKNADGTASSTSVPSAVVPEGGCPDPAASAVTRQRMPDRQRQPRSGREHLGSGAPHSRRAPDQPAGRDTRHRHDRDAVPRHVDLQRARPGCARLRDRDPVSTSGQSRRRVQRARTVGRS